jgi:hypothetical protein
MSYCSVLLLLQIWAFVRKRCHCQADFGGCGAWGGKVLGEELGAELGNTGILGEGLGARVGIADGASLGSVLG